MKKLWLFFGRAVMNVLTGGNKGLTDIGQRSRVIFLNAVTLAGAVMISLFSAISLASGNLPLALACAVAAGVVTLNFVLIRLFRLYLLGGIVDCVVIFVFYYYLVLSGGEAGSGILWINTYPLISLFLLGSGIGSVVALSFGAAVGLAIFTPALNAAAFPPLYSARVMGTYFFIWLFSLIYEVVRTNTLRRLEDSNRHLAEASAALRAEKQQTDDILAGVREGIFLLDGELRLGTSHSRYLETIFQGDQLAGRSLLELLKPLLPAQDYSSAADFFDLLLAGAVNPELLAEINPLSEIRCLFPAPDGQAHSKLLRFAFSRLGAVGAAGAAGAAGTAFSVLGVVVDASQEYELQQQLSVEERKHKQSMENLFRIIHVDPAMMREFIGDTEAELDQANELLKTEGTDREHIMVALGSSFHAIKGNALLLGLEEFAAKVHGYEDTVKELRSRGHSWRDLLSLTVGLGEIRGDLEELNGLITRIESFQALTVSRDGGAASLLQLSLDKFVQKESSRLGVPVSFDFRIAEGAAITEEHRKLVKDVLVQLVRNSFAHGFEHETTRLKLKKNPRCAISVQVDEQAGSLVLRYRDDGNGLDIGRIRAKAASLPLLAGRAAALSDQEVIKLIFMPGFSTARQTSLDAGRGEGMALVRNRVTAAGGRLGVKNKPGQYLEWTVTLPGMAVAEVSSA